MKELLTNKKLVAILLIISAFLITINIAVLYINLTMADSPFASFLVKDVEEKKEVEDEVDVVEDDDEVVNNGIGVQKARDLIEYEAGDTSYLELKPAMKSLGKIIFKLPDGSENEVATSGSYESSIGNFSIALPENAWYADSGAHTPFESSNIFGGVFTVQFNADGSVPDQDKGKSISISILYGTPFIDGKGGGCREYSSSTFKELEVLTCDMDDSMNFGYFRHPNKEVEYFVSIDTTGYKTEDAQKNVDLAFEFLKEVFVFE